MHDKLEPKYGLITTITIVVGSVVGVGIFLRAPRMSLSAGGDTTAIIVAWIIGALMIVPLAIIISEIAAMSKRSGGAQVYAEEVYNERFGFGIGWAQAFFYLPGNCSFMLYLTADYTLKVAGREDLGFSAIVFLSCFYAIALFVINTLSGRIGGQIQVVATFIKVIPLVLIGVVGSFYFGEPLSKIGGTPEVLQTLSEHASLPFWAKVAAVIPAALFAYDGWIFVGIISREVKNPGRNIPLAIIGGMLVIVALYLLFTFASFKLATPQAWATGGVTNTDIAAKLFGSFFGDIINVFVLISAIGVSNANTLALVRAPYALAMSRRFPGSSWLSKISPKTKMPTNSGMLALIVGLLYILVPYFFNFHRNGDTYGLFIDSALLLFFFFYAIICLGVVRMRRTHPDLERPFRVPFIYLFMVMGLIGACFGVYGLATAYAGPLLKWVILFIICACSGFLVFSFTKKEEHDKIVAD